MGQRPAVEHARQRRHRWITVPSGVLWFLCIWLPGYEDCGIHHPMSRDPEMIAICCIGLVIIAAGWLARGRRFERAIAILCALLALVFAALLGLLAGASRAYIGLHLACVSSASLFLGCLIWEREARGKYQTASYLFRVVLILAIFALLLTALLSTWRPPPDHPVDIPYVGPT